ncbi:MULTISPECIES: hypothetical protein [Bacillus]|uniref:hypothetical protein n=1 Tax=Bacillus TaxID=1386 RepID=UPI001F326375|nr:hypothetical protein [Bacillus cereus]UIJ66694.1 hypothetical protein LW858_28655 [Bacillus cereus]HDR8251254.1 hypothetical protein [Bacillus cereus]
MEFENRENTGFFKTINQNALIFFLDKNSALNYRKRLLKMDSGFSRLEVVGIDRHYWNAAKKHFKEININIFICLDAIQNLGEFVDFQKLDKIIND